MADLTVHATADIEADLWQLRGFAGTSFTTDNHDLVVLDCPRNLVTPFTDGQLFRIRDPGKALAALIGMLRGLLRGCPNAGERLLAGRFPKSPAQAVAVTYQTTFDGLRDLIRIDSAGFLQ